MICYLSRYLLLFSLSLFAGSAAYSQQASLKEEVALEEWLQTASENEIEAAWPRIQDSLIYYLSLVETDQIERCLQQLAAKQQAGFSNDLKAWLDYWEAQLAFQNQKSAAAIEKLDGLIQQCDNDEVLLRICAMAHQLRADINARVFLAFNEAIGDYRACVDYFLGLGDTLSYLRAASRLAQLYGEHQFYELADKERQQIFDYGEQLEQYDLLIVSHLTAGLDDLFKGDSTAVLEHLAAARSYIDKIDGHPRYEYFLNRFYLAHYFYNRQADKALPHYQRIEALRPIIAKNERHKDHFLRDQATWYALNGQYAAALAIGKPQLEKAKKESRKHDIIVILEIMEYAASQQGNWALALELSKEREAQKDSIVQAARLTQTAYYNDLYEQEKEIAQQSRMREIKTSYQNRIRIFMAIALALLFASLALYFYRGYKFVNRERSLQQKFSQDLIQVRSVEQSRIARDLHDRIGQELVLLKQGISRNEVVVPETNQQVDKIINDLRTISRDLYDPGPEQLGFKLAINRLISRFDDYTDIFWASDIPDAPPPLDIETQGHVFSILREAFQNIVRHSKARAVNVVGKWEGQKFQLTIQDNGKGMAVDVNDGIGIRGMRERAEIANLSIKITSKIGKGTKIKLEN